MLRGVMGPIKLFGLVLIVLSFLILLFYYMFVCKSDASFEFGLFAYFMSLLHMVTGIGVVLKKKWGFDLFKFYLKSLFYCIPIGTFISYLTFKYIKKNNIEEYFKARSS